MDIKALAEKAMKMDLSSIGAMNDAFDTLVELAKEDFARAHELNKRLRVKAGEYARSQGSSEMLEVYKKSLLFDAPYDFDAYLRYIEWNKPRDKTFYAIRRHYLKRYVNAYQEILDGKLDFLSISMPKRGGKSQLGINFVNMLSGRRPDRSTLMEGTGDDLVTSFYKGCLEYLQPDGEYLYYDIFPNAKLVQTNADNKTINLEKGIECDPLEFWVALNAMYSDYATVAKKLGVNNMDFYTQMAKAFLDDKDALPDKRARYYEYIVK